MGIVSDFKNHIRNDIIVDINQLDILDRITVPSYEAFQFQYPFNIDQSCLDEMSIDD